MWNKTDRTARSRATTLLLSRVWPLTVVLAGGLLGGCASGEGPESAGTMSDTADAAHPFAGIPQQDNVLGDAAAPLTLTEFSDLRCSHCRHFANDTLPVLVDRYVRAGKLRIVFGNLPILGPASIQAARMAAAVGLQGHEFEFIDAFFSGAAGALVGDDLLKRIAGDVPGVDVEAALAQRDSDAVTTQLADAHKLAVEYKIPGTPSFLLGKTGAEPELLHNVRATKPETLTTQIDALLATL